MSYDDILTIVLSKWTIYVLISILLVIIFGYLWNYFIIKELREMNKILHQDLNHMMDVIAHSRGPAPGPYTNVQSVNYPVNKDQNYKEEENLEYEERS